MRHGIHVTTAVFIAISSSVGAQGLSSTLGAGPGIGGTAGQMAPPRTIPLLSEESSGARRHMGPTGKACLTVNGEAQPEKVNPNLFEHLIIGQNECSQRIKVQVCYYQSQHCVPMDVPPYGRDEVVLGVMPAMDAFRFEFREQF
jgi:hypothetical protein